MPRSQVYLPKLDNPPLTILEHLTLRFPHVARTTWQDRLRQGLVTTSTGMTVGEASPYEYGLTLYYTKEVPLEPQSDAGEVLLYRDEELIVVDKPHRMSVTPAGQFVARSLLNRLKEQTGIDDLAPLHRLDHDTAGVVLFGIRPASRQLYHGLFAQSVIEREYLAVAQLNGNPSQTNWMVRNRLISGVPWFRQQIAPNGIPTAITEIDLIETSGMLGLFRLKPATGKKHQLRVHMSSLGFPILGDMLYPEISESREGGFPLQLLAYRVSFSDPITGAHRRFQSHRRLTAFPDAGLWTIPDD